MPAQAGAHRVEFQVGLALSLAFGNVHLDVDGAEIGIAIFEEPAQRVGEGIFNAGPDRPAPFGLLVVGIRVREIVVERELGAADREAARRI